MIKTDICDLLQIEYPILQGGMAWLGTAELAAAVSEAGGLGIIGAGHMPPDIFRNEIHKLKSVQTNHLVVILCSCLHLLKKLWK